MRLWSIHPYYLDSKGLVALWRESLLAQSCLIKGEYTECKEYIGMGMYSDAVCCNLCKGTGKIKTPYYNHPQLLRFKQTSDPIKYIGLYLHEIFIEADKREYKFDRNKIYGDMYTSPQLTVTKGQLIFEFNHLQKKLNDRDWGKWEENERSRSINSFSPFDIKVNPIFKVIEGDVESWEKIK